MSSKQLLLFFIALNFISFSLFSHGGEEQNRIIKGHADNTLIKFTENKNQWDAKILYAAQLDGGTLFLEKNCFTYNFYDKETLRKNHASSVKEKKYVSNSNIRSHAFRVHFVNSLPSVASVANEPTSDYNNYFIGNDPSKWASHVKNYKEVNYQNIYDGINLEILGLENSLKYNFYVSPNSNPQQIKLMYDGVDKIFIDKGELKIKTSLNEIIEQKPYAYQDINNERVTVPCEFVLKNKTVSFHFPNGYDSDYELVIDPLLVFASSTGSTADNFGMTATYDNAGNLYGGGTIFNIGYPTTVGAFDPTFNGPTGFGYTDVAITKYNATGNALIFSTYLGGSSSTEVVSSLVVNAQDELIAFGATGSANFPMTTNGYDKTFNGGISVSFNNYYGTNYTNGTDIYVVKFNSAGTALLGSTFMGGTDNDGVNGSVPLQKNYGDTYRGEVQVDGAGNVYVASCTFSNNFPISGGAQANFGGGLDGVVFKLDNNLNSLLWSTYLGGSLDDACYGIAIDKAGNIFTAGGTNSNNFNTTAGSVGPVFNGGQSDGFVTKINPAGNAILASACIGTNQYDQNFFVQTDTSDFVYVLGQSLGNMPVSPNTYSNANSKQFIWKMDNALSTRIVSTIFGNGNGQINFSPSAFLVDNCFNIYVSGWGGDIMTLQPTNGMPLTNNAYQSSTDGFNFYLMELDRDFKALKYATYFGGALSDEHVDGGTSRFDKKGIVYQAVCSGCGGNDDFPVTPGAWPNTGANVNHSTNCNMGTFKFDFQDIPVQAVANATPNDTICVGSTMSFTNGSINALNYSWDFGDGSPVDTVTNPSHTYNTIGTFTVTVIAFDDSDACVVSDTFYLSVVVIPYPVVDLGNDTIICINQTVTLDAGNPGCTYLWSTGATTQTIIAQPTGNYWVIVTNGGICSVSDTINISPILQVKPFGNDTTLCIGNTVPLDALNNPGSSYLWSTGDTTQTITVNTTGTYWVQINTGPCTLFDTIIVTFVNYPVVNLPPDTVFCNTPNLLLDAGNPGSTYLWSTSATTQTITATATGTYYVEVANGSCKRSDTIVITNIVLVKPFGRDTTLCDGGVVNLNALNAVPTNYLWSNGSGAQTINVTTTGMYWVSIDSLHCNLRDTINVTFVPYPVVVLTQDTVVCGTPNLVLDPGPVADSYLWSTGATTQNINVIDGGTYYLTASNDLNGVSCSRSDTTVVTEIPPVELGHYYSFCNVDYISLDAGEANATYLWSTGETTQSIQVVAGGVYWVNVSKQGCLMTDTVTIDGEIGDGALYFPNTFTPNNDLLNDKFNGKGADIIQYKLMIFNRWGELIYDTNTLDGGWDGKYKGTIVKNDVYVYKVNYKTKCDTSLQTRIGHVTVYR